MTQATLDDDELFSEAASEIRDDVETSLEAARNELPTGDELWEIDASNSLGALNGLRSALAVGDAQEQLRNAKKWFTMGKKADAFENADDLAAEIETVEELVTDIEDAHEAVSDLASTVPELRSTLEELEESADPDADTDADAAEA